MTEFPRTPHTTLIITPAVAHRRPRPIAWSGHAARGVLAVSLGLLLGALGGGLGGLAMTHLGVTTPPVALAMVCGGAGEGALGGLFIGGLVAVGAFD